MDRREHARQLRETAVRLLELAAEIEQPRTIATTRVTTCTCNVCGEQVKGLNRIGDLCFNKRCKGTYRLDPEPGRCDKCSGPVHPQTKALNGGMCATCHPFEIDPEPGTATCDVCGTQLVGGEWAGQPCGVVLRGEACTGTFRLDPEPTTKSRICTCDVCGHCIAGQIWDGARHHDYREPECTGTYRLEPEPERDEFLWLTSMDDEPVGVSLAELAAEQAIADFRADDPDNDDDCLDIASTYRGRRA